MYCLPTVTTMIGKPLWFRSLLVTLPGFGHLSSPFPGFIVEYTYQSEGIDQRQDPILSQALRSRVAGLMNRLFSPQQAVQLPGEGEVHDGCHSFSTIISHRLIPINLSCTPGV